MPTPNVPSSSDFSVNPYPLPPIDNDMSGTNCIANIDIVAAGDNRAVPQRPGFTGLPTPQPTPVPGFGQNVLLGPNGQLQLTNGMLAQGPFLGTPPPNLPGWMLGGIRTGSRGWIIIPDLIQVPNGIQINIEVRFATITGVAVRWQRGTVVFNLRRGGHGWCTTNLLDSIRRGVLPPLTQPVTIRPWTRGGFDPNVPFGWNRQPDVVIWDIQPNEAAGNLTRRVSGGQTQTGRNLGTTTPIPPAAITHGRLPVPPPVRPQTPVTVNIRVPQPVQNLRPLADMDFGPDPRFRSGVGEAKTDLVTMMVIQARANDANTFPGDRGEHAREINELYAEWGDLLGPDWWQVHYYILLDRVKVLKRNRVVRQIGNNPLSSNVRYLMERSIADMACNDLATFLFRWSNDANFRAVVRALPPEIIARIRRCLLVQDTDPNRFFPRPPGVPASDFITVDCGTDFFTEVSPAYVMTIIGLANPPDPYQCDTCPNAGGAQTLRIQTGATWCTWQSDLVWPCNHFHNDPEEPAVGPLTWTMHFNPTNLKWELWLQSGVMYTHDNTWNARSSVTFNREITSIEQDTCSYPATVQIAI